VFTEADMNRVLVQLDVLLPYAYAQFVAEDATTRDYRVVAERIPGGSAGYSVAHRTGVIGQVFRRQCAIIVPDTRNHPLYDPYDTAVDWEIAIPLFRENALVGVLNVEGCGTLAPQPEQWNGILRLVAAETGHGMPGSPPDAQSGVLVQTQCSFFADERELVETARHLASDGRSVLMIGALPEFAPSSHPTLNDVEQGRIPLAECIRGVDRCIDALILNGGGLRLFESLGGWPLVDGRYEFVLARE